MGRACAHIEINASPKFVPEVLQLNGSCEGAGVGGEEVKSAF